MIRCRVTRLRSLLYRTACSFTPPDPLVVLVPYVIQSTTII
jgi:hypothetical protein